MASSKIEVGSSYHIYGKMGSMSRFKACGNGEFTTNLLYATIYTIRTEEDVVKFQRELDFLNNNNGGGVFEARKVKGY